MDDILHIARVHAYQPNISDEGAKKVCRAYIEQKTQLAKAEEKLRIAVEGLQSTSTKLKRDMDYLDLQGNKQPNRWMVSALNADKNLDTALQRIAALEQIEQQEKVR